jgi:hypothetical protein
MVDRLIHWACVDQAAAEAVAGFQFQGSSSSRRWAG